MSDLVAAEWLKLRTVRLLYGIVPAAVALAGAAVAGAVLSADGASELVSSEGVRRVVAVTGTGSLVPLVMGILVSAGEYRHGTAVDTFLTTPQRRRVLAAKLVVGGCVGAGVGVLSVLVCVGVATVLSRGRGATFPVTDGDVWLTLVGAVGYMTLFAVIGVALGALVRNQVLAVGVALAWLAVVEHTLVNLVPDIGRWLPVAAGQAIVRTPLDGLLSSAAGVAVLVGYGAAITLVALRLETMRDA